MLILARSRPLTLLRDSGGWDNVLYDELLRPYTYVAGNRLDTNTADAVATVATGIVSGGTAAVRTLTFSSNTEGTTLNLVGGTLAAARDATDGFDSPLGCLKFTTTTNGDNQGRMEANGDTWMTYGVPANATVTGVTLVSVAFRMPLTTGQSSKNFSIHLQNGSFSSAYDIVTGFLWDGSDPLPNSTAWKRYNQQRYATVSGANQSPSTVVNIQIAFESVSSGGTNVDFRVDDIVIAVHYTLPGAQGGIFAQSLGDASITATGTVSGGGGGAVSGVLAKTLDNATDTATGTVAVTGALSKTLGAATDTATGTVAVTGSLAKTLDSTTDSATGTVAVVGSLSKTLDAATDIATGAVAVTGSLAKTLDVATDTATGAVAVTGTLAKTLDSATDTATGTVAITGVVSKMLDAATDTATGTVAVAGTLAKTLDAATIAAVGDTGPNEGLLNKTLDQATSVATGVVPVMGTAASTTAGAAVAATGVVAVVGQSSSTLSPATVVGTAVANTAGSLASILDSATISAQGGAVTIDHPVVVDATLDSATGVATGVVPIIGQLSKSLDDTGITSHGSAYVAQPIRADVAGDYEASVVADYDHTLSVVDYITAMVVVEPITEIDMSLTLKAGDRYPSFQATLNSSIAFDITQASEIRFVWRMAKSSDRNVGIMTIIDPTTKKVGYSWGPDDTLDAGSYEAEVELEFPGGLVMTIPNKGFYKFTIAPTI